MRPLASYEECFRDATALLALLGPAGNLLSRRLSELHSTTAPLEQWWRETSKDRAYWACMTMGEPALCGVSQVAQACSLLCRGLDRRGLLLLQLSKPYLTSDTMDELTDLFTVTNAAWEELGALVKPGIAAHDRGDFPEALQIYEAAIAQWPGHPWPWQEHAITSMEITPHPEPRRHPSLMAAMLRDPFFPGALWMRNPEQAALLDSHIRPLLEFGAVDPATVGRFAQAAQGIDHWSTAHARILMDHMGCRTTNSCCTSTLLS